MVKCGIWEGEFFSNRMHVDCNECAGWLAERWSAWGDEYPWLEHVEWRETTREERAEIRTRWPRIGRLYLEDMDDEEDEDRQALPGGHGRRGGRGVTTVAVRGGVMAADSLVVQSGIRVCHTRKLVRLPDRRILGVAGDIQLMREIVRWVSDDEGRWAARPVTASEQGANFDLLLLDPDGSLSGYDATGHLDWMHCEYTAIGGGRDIALGAMAMGATAVQAVQAAALLHTTTGGTIHWMSTSGEEGAT